jgi:hypothetical protein
MLTNRVWAAGMLLAFLSRPAVGQCPCPQDKGDLVFSYEFAGGPKLIICGFANGNPGSAEVESYSDITVMDGRDHRILLSIEASETPLSLNMFRFHVREGQVIIQQIVRLPSEPGWQWAPRPFFEKNVYCVDGRLVISEWRNIFIVPPKTQNEIDAFLDTYENRFEMSGDPLELIDKLMLCALNGSQKAERLLLSFPKDHPEIFDGAIAETYEDDLYFYRQVLKR